jgi:hypothetical protein
MTADSSASHPTRLTRRTLTATPLAMLMGLVDPAGVARTSQPAPDSECSAAPGVQLLIDLGRGLPVMSSQELAIPAGWTSFFDQQMGIGFYHPADWGIVRLWADQLSAGGAPVWTAQQPLMPIVASARAVAPSGDAAFETVVSNLPNVGVTPTDAATLARRGVTGDGVAAEPICTLRTAFSYDWVDAAFAGGATIMTMGVIETNSGPFAPSSVLVWYSLVAPEAQFEAYVRDVFARILYALIPAPVVNPSPTPTP